MEEDDCALCTESLSKLSKLCGKGMHIKCRDGISKVA